MSQQPAATAQLDEKGRRTAPDLPAFKKIIDLIPTLVPNFSTSYQQLEQGLAGEDEKQKNKTVRSYQEQNHTVLKSKVIAAYKDKPEYKNLRDNIQGAEFPVDAKDAAAFQARDEYLNLNQRWSRLQQDRKMATDPKLKPAVREILARNLAARQTELAQEETPLDEDKNKSRFAAYVAEMSKDKVWADSDFFEVFAKEVGCGFQLDVVDKYARNSRPQTAYVGRTIAGEPKMVVENSRFHHDTGISEHFEYKGFELGGQFYPAPVKNGDDGNCAWYAQLMFLTHLQQVADGRAPAPQSIANATQAAAQSYTHIGQQLTSPVKQAEKDRSVAAQTPQVVQNPQAATPTMVAGSTPSMVAAAPHQPAPPTQQVAAIPQVEVLTLDEKYRALEFLLEDRFDSCTFAQLDAWAADPAWQQSILSAHHALTDVPPAATSTVAANANVVTAPAQRPAPQQPVAAAVIPAQSQREQEARSLVLSEADKIRALKECISETQFRELSRTPGALVRYADRPDMQMQIRYTVLQLRELDASLPQAATSNASTSTSAPRQATVTTAPAGRATSASTATAELGFDESELQAALAASLRTAQQEERQRALNAKLNTLFQAAERGSLRASEVAAINRELDEQQMDENIFRPVPR